VPVQAWEPVDPIWAVVAVIRVWVGAVDQISVVQAVPEADRTSAVAIGQILAGIQLQAEIAPALVVATDRRLVVVIGQESETEIVPERCLDWVAAIDQVSAKEIARALEIDPAKETDPALAMAIDQEFDQGLGEAANAIRSQTCPACDRGLVAVGNAIRLETSRACVQGRAAAESGIHSLTIAPGPETVPTLVTITAITLGTASEITPTLGTTTSVTTISTM
jgi:hypothetical protein